MVVIIIFARGTFDDIYLRLTFGNVCHKKSGLVVNKFLVCRFGDSAAGICIIFWCLLRTFASINIAPRPRHISHNSVPVKNELENLRFQKIITALGATLCAER